MVIPSVTFVLVYMMVSSTNVTEEPVEVNGYAPEKGTFED
jgi:hypothetical protein